MAEPVRITKQDLAEKVEAGWKKDALAEHYGLPMTQMTKALQQAGLRIRKFHKPKFELVDDPVEDINVEAEEVQHETEAEALIEEQITEQEVAPSAGW